ncbi:MAG: hypothetical protein SXA11_09205 [Cyanobacteriota bacterium]|nr:hypothetical protein [Cyanobacteriota bacterium]
MAKTSLAIAGDGMDYLAICRENSQKVNKKPGFFDNTFAIFAEQ